MAKNVKARIGCFWQLSGTPANSSEVILGEFSVCFHEFIDHKFVQICQPIYHTVESKFLRGIPEENSTICTGYQYGRQPFVLQYLMSSVFWFYCVFGRLATDLTVATVDRSAQEAQS